MRGSETLHFAGRGVYNVRALHISFGIFFAYRSETERKADDESGICISKTIPNDTHPVPRVEYLALWPHCVCMRHFGRLGRVRPFALGAQARASAAAADIRPPRCGVHLRVNHNRTECATLYIARLAPDIYGADAEMRITIKFV